VPFEAAGVVTLDWELDDGVVGLPEDEPELDVLATTAPGEHAVNSSPAVATATTPATNDLRSLMPPPDVSPNSLWSFGPVTRDFSETLLISL
jgi:hypothetical protein